MIRSAQQRRAQPARQFAVTVLAMFVLAVLGYLKHAPGKQPAARGALHARGLDTLADENKLCRHVHRKQDQCAWIRGNCPDEEAGLISYLSLYYCRLPHLKPLGFIIVVSWTALLFSTIGIAASDFFCVNLSTISSILGMSESMAGVTLLAFGNGSPDVFSTFAAVKSNSGSLAVGELIGAAGFITAVVSGSMALVRPFKVAKRSFLRDVGFFVVAVSFSMIFVANGKLELWECAAMVGFYIFYVIIVVIWHWWLNQRRLRREMHAVARGHYTDLTTEEETTDEVYQDEDDGARTPYSRHASTDDFRDLELADFGEPEIDELDEEADRDKWMGELTSSMRVTRTPAGERRTMFTPIRPSLIGALEFQSTLHSLRKSRNIQTIPINLRRYSDDPNFTHMQAQQYAHSTASDPERASMYDGIVGTTEEEESESNAGDAAGSRARAKSANAADLLTPRPRSWHRPHPSETTLQPNNAPNSGGSTATEPFPGTQSPPGVIGPEINIHPPELTLTPPAITLNDDEPAEDQGRSRSSTGSLLLPSQPGSLSSSGHRSPAQAVQDQRVSRGSRRPSLSRSRHGSRRHSLVSSPLIGPQHDGSRSPFGIAQRCMSPEGINRVQSEEEPETEFKPLSWWPYKVFVPPETIVRTLFPTLQNWREKNIGGKIVGVLSLPSFFLLTITLPVVEPQATDPELVPAHASKNASYTSAAPTPSIKPQQQRESANGIATTTTVDHTPQQNGQTRKPNTNPTIVTTETIAPEHPHAAVLSPRDWNRWLVIIQCYTAPFFVVLTVWANLDSALTTAPHALFHATLYSLLASSVALALILATTTPTHPPRWHPALTFVGFAVAITWISSIANEVVGVLKAIGIIFNISDAILGLTIFAVGNSLGDLVADITVARLGYPVMALSACFGGPMLNILLGVGLSGLYMTLKGADDRQRKHPGAKWKAKPYHVEVSVSLIISAGVLLVTLVGLLVVVPLNGWRMDRKIGWGLIALWVVATAGNLAVELSGYGDDRLG